MSQGGSGRAKRPWSLLEISPYVESEHLGCVTLEESPNLFKSYLKEGMVTVGTTGGYQKDEGDRACDLAL